jgi:hypothetical protein
MTTVELGKARRAVLAAFVFGAGYAGMVLTANGQEAAPITCIAQGRDYRIGDIACIPACHGQQRLAKCEQTNNGGVTWTSISDTCPQAMHTPLPQMSIGVREPDILNATLIAGLPKLLLR